MEANKILSMTPRELSIMMSAHVERQYDEIEREALFAIMHESAHRSKRPKAGDLFKRPVDEYTAEKRTESMKEQAEQASKYLAQFEQFSGKEDDHGE